MNKKLIKSSLGFKGGVKGFHLSFTFGLIKRGCFFCAVLLGISQALWAADAPLSSRPTAGPGVPSIDFQSTDVSRILSQNRTGQAIAAVSMHDGYLIVPMNADGGGGRGRGVLLAYDITDPESPIEVFDSRDYPERYHNPDSLDYVGNWGEAHQMAMTGNRLIVREIDDGVSELSIFDMTGFPTTLPRTLGRIRFPDITSVNGYVGGSFSPAILGDRYVYAPTGGRGTYIFDISDPANPSHVGIIPRSQLGDRPKQSAVVLGNWLILSQSRVNQISDVVIFDITDPVSPVPIGSFDARIGYQGWVCGSLFFTGRDGGPLEAYDFADPANIQRRVFNTVAGPVLNRPEYGFCQDNNVFVGHYPGLTKWDLSQPGAPLVAHARPVNPRTDDYAFLTPIGNMAIIASDHNNPNNWNVGIHQAEADRTPPAVDFVLPVDGATNVNVHTKIGISFTDFPDVLSLGTDTIRVQSVRPNGRLRAATEGSFSQQFGIVNFLPEQSLLANTTYRVTLVAGGVRDWSGNTISQNTVISTFTTGSADSETNNPNNPSLIPPDPILADQSATLLIDSNGTNASYAWDFGDGTPVTAFTSNTSINHLYSEPGNYQVTLIVRASNREVRRFAEIVVSNPLANTLPVQSSTIIFDSQLQRVFNVNPDNNTVTAIDAITDQKLFEIAVGRNPQSIAINESNRAWVVNKDDASVTEFNPTSGAIIRTLPIPNGSDPHAVVIDVANQVAYLSLEGRSSVAKMSLASGQIMSELTVGKTPRHLALDGENQRLFVGHFIASDESAKVSMVNLNTFSLVQEIELEPSFDEDGFTNGRGLPNYLGALALSPDLTQAIVPAKKDNIFRGELRDGNDLTFEHTVRSMAAQIDLDSLSEATANRVDFDNSDFATAVAYSPLGNRAYVATNGTSTVWSVDAYRPENKVAFPSGGSAPRGLVTNEDGSKLFIHNFLSREITVFNLSDQQASMVATVDLVEMELLEPNVLRGKEIFYNSEDTRLNQEGYMSCSSCHLDGGEDGRVWDFTDFGEGLRNTIDLRGRAGTKHGRLHWTANFDEVHDFENQIRSVGRGTGLLTEAQFEQTADTLGNPKAGFSEDLDALSAYLESLDLVGLSPFRNTNGSLTNAAEIGKQLFQAKGCNQCHDGEIFTDSPSGQRHDIGTIKASSGQRLGVFLFGLDTPTLKGLWRTAPYLHDGSAQTLADAVGAHENVSVTNGELNNLVAYLSQIDDSEIQHCLAIGQLCDDARSDTVNSTIQADCSCGVNNAPSLDGGEFHITAVHSGLNLASVNNRRGGSIQQISGDPVPWRFNSLGDNLYGLIHPNGFAVDISGASTAIGANAIQWLQHGRANQQFSIIEINPNQYAIRNLNSGLCLDVVNSNTDSGANVRQWTCNNNANQLWDIRPSEPVVFWRNEDFSGVQWALTEGVYLFPVVRRSPVGNDAISAIQIPVGYSVTVCEKGGAGGICEVYTSDTSLLGEVLNNEISYIEISRL